MFINVGVKYGKYGEYIPTKKALKEAVRADPLGVWADSTLPMGERWNNSIDTLPAGIRLSVVGPDPFNSRKWYATIERTSKGLRVS